MEEKTNEETLNDDIDSGTEEDVKTFTQEEVDVLIAKGLEGKQGSKNDTFIARQAKRYGITEEEYMEKMETQQHRRDMEKEAADEGVEDVDKYIKDKTLEDRISKIENKGKENAKWVEQETELLEKYPSIDLRKLDTNKSFVKFVSNQKPGLSLLNMYEDFVELIGDVKADTLRQQTNKANRATNPGRGGSLSNDKTHGLSPTQLALCEENGIKPKDFASSLATGKKLMS